LVFEKSFQVRWEKDRGRRWKRGEFEERFAGGFGSALKRNSKKIDSNRRQGGKVDESRRPGGIDRVAHRRQGASTNGK
jgi:hypothetical protein